MAKKILFSPVGGTDPISNYNCHDGALLHICRVYKPDVICMYMSKEILKLHNEDNRYIYCLDKLKEKLGTNWEYKVIEREELIEVQEFNFFYEDFKTEISNIELCDEDELLINISSGTPAMKSGLAVLATLNDFPATLIQVTTPEKSMNEHHHKDYDVETLWELNEDNSDDFVNRCKVVSCPALNTIKNEEIIKKHVLAYDYAAALEVAKMIPEDKTKGYIELLEFAYTRLMLDESKLRGYQEYRKQFLPFRDGLSMKCVEYALYLNIKLKKHEFSDYIRAISPIFIELLELTLDRYCRINISDYCRCDRTVKKWDINKLLGTPVLDALNSEYRGGFNGSDIVRSSHICIIINELSKDEGLKKLVTELRTAEEKVRNLAAHEIVAITPDRITSEAKMEADVLMKKIIQLFNYTGINISEETWKSYDVMNEYIISKIV